METATNCEFGWIPHPSAARRQKESKVALKVVAVSTSGVSVLDLAALVGIGEAFTRLRDSGWTVHDGVSSISVTLDPASDPTGALAELEPLIPAALNVEASGKRSGSRVVVRLVNGVPEIVEAPAADPRELFDERPAQDDAVAALGGDAVAALRLPMQWRIEATISLAKLLDVPVGTLVNVSLAAETVTDHIAAITAVDIRHLLGGADCRVFVALDTPDHAHLGSVVLAGVPVGGHTASVDLRPASLLPAERLQKSPPSPGTLIPQDDRPAPPVWRPAASHLRTLAAQLVWRALATDELPQDGGLVLEFVGFRKSRFPLPDPAPWEDEHVQGALLLRAWALHDASPDRLLAVRQVVSLYDADDAPYGHAPDVLASAEVIYAGLRTDAVAEAVKSARDAHAQAQDAARQTAKSATDMLKSATDRMLASLVAVGAILMANAGRVLPDATGRLLILLVAAFMATLAAAAVFLEGPLLGLPAKKLRSDLDHQAGLLTVEQRERIVRLPSLVAVRTRTIALRWCVPITYVLFAVLLAVLGHPDQYR